MTRSLACLLLLSACAPRLYSDDGGGDGLWSPPDNTWPVTPPPEGLVGEGVEPGQVVLDIRGKDQFGDELSLWQFAGQVVLVDISTLWCAPCQELGKGTEAVYQEFKDDGFVYLTLIHENDRGREPSAEDLTLWSSLPSYNADPQHPYDAITAPIVADPKGASGSIAAVRNGNYPVAFVVGRDLRVAKRIDPVSEGAIVEAIEEALAE